MHIDGKGAEGLDAGQFWKRELILVVRIDEEVRIVTGGVGLSGSSLMAAKRSLMWVSASDLDSTLRPVACCEAPVSMVTFAQFVSKCGGSINTEMVA